MARTKQAGRAASKGKAPRKSLATKAARGRSQEEDIELKVSQVTRHQRFQKLVLEALDKAEISIVPTAFHIPPDVKMMDLADNDPSWMENAHDVGDDAYDDVLDVHPSELTSVRAVLNTLPRSLTTSSSSSTPSAIVTKHITLRITQANMTWHEPPTKKQKVKLRALESQDVMITLTPNDRSPFRPELKIKGIGTPITIECFMNSHYTPLGEVLPACEPSVVVNIPACDGRAAGQKVLSVARIVNGAASNHQLLSTAGILVKKYEHDFNTYGIRTSCIKCGHPAWIYCMDHETPFCKHHYEHRQGRPPATHAQYDVLPEFDDCNSECQSLINHPAYGKKQLSCFINMFNLFEKDEMNAWKLSSQNICADVVCGGIAIWDEDFSHLVKPTEIITKFKTIFSESTEIQVNTGARRIIDFFCFHTAYHSVQYARCGESKHSLSVESVLQCIGTRVEQMSQALQAPPKSSSSTSTTRSADQEYVCFVMGCDLDEHAMDLRKTAGIKAHVIHFMKSPQFVHLSSFIERFRVLTLDLGMSVMDAFRRACQMTAVPARLVYRYDTNTVVTWTREDDGIYREVWNRSTNKCLLRNVAVKIEPVVPPQQTIAEVLANGPDPTYALKATSTATSSSSS